MRRPYYRKRKPLNKKLNQKPRQELEDCLISQWTLPVFPYHRARVQSFDTLHDLSLALLTTVLLSVDSGITQLFHYLQTKIMFCYRLHWFNFHLHVADDIRPGSCTARTCWHRLPSHSYLQMSSVIRIYRQMPSAAQLLGRNVKQGFGLLSHRLVHEGPPFEVMPLSAFVYLVKFHVDFINPPLGHLHLLGQLLLHAFLLV